MLPRGQSGRKRCPALTGKSTEECYLLEGRVVVETEEGSVEFGQGDFVTFQKGLSCVWDIKEPVKKHFNFK